MADRYSEINEVISYIHQNIFEPLPLSRLAAYISYSPYHFARIFKEKVGLPPLYYVSSLRLQKAKDLLLQTNLSVRDIGLEIGQQSLGTFTTRFTERVGVTPSDFRNSALQADIRLRSLQELNGWRTSFPSLNRHSRVEGTIQSTIPFEGIILIGLFAKPIPEGLPLHGTLVPSVGEFCITDVKPGIYYLMATSVPWGMKAIDFLLPHTILRFRSLEPIIVEPNSPVPQQQVRLNVPQPDDPPILVSLSLLMDNFINQVLQYSNR
ncbi:helix-turn-helix transcriptional regulator [Paenibacillus sp. sptzw28]|uniref:helix-turn-helix domain-containing protein n=1 Tax=Paenibacillus sp. sptzw28 TaxID=715179 RepID=UPI001C6E3A1B|nr:helix-turn-helix transcriptional regulator [Paenibacillus sp. sptzw28]QYR19369.1 helix-turn-helix transcriptional regulator [Paenibacillus sp. sptzw28]